jgi:hypothetical protein
MTKQRMIEMFACVQILEMKVKEFPIDQNSGPFVMEVQKQRMKSIAADVEEVKRCVHSLLEEKGFTDK